jgi:PAS domain S-box-containing protein
MGDLSTKDKMLQYIKTLEKEIADLRKTGNKLAESEQLLRTLTEKSFAGLYVVQDGRFRFLNVNAACFAGYKPEDLVGKNSDIILHPEDREKVKKEARAMLRGKSISPHEFRIVTKSGSIRWILETVASIKYEGRTAILGNSMDITDRKLAEEALRESERRLADIIEFLPDATLAINREGIVIAWNRAIEEMTGISARDMAGKGNYEYAIPFYGKRRPIMLDLILKPDRKIERSYSAILKREKDLLIVETWVPSLRGEKAFLWGKASPLYDGKGKIIGAIETIRDITERQQAEEALKKREQELETKNIQLQDLNAALRVLLKQREEDKSDLEEKVLANVKRLIMPCLEKLKSESTGHKAGAYLDTLESNLRDIVSPFAHRLSSKYMNLTNREVQIAGLIKESRTTKEIAELLNISESAINIHRFNMRRKLGLTKKHNLQSYLLSLA